METEAHGTSALTRAWQGQAQTPSFGLRLCYPHTAGCRLMVQLYRTLPGDRCCVFSVRNRSALSLRQAQSFTVLPWAWSMLQNPEYAGLSGYQQVGNPESHSIRPECHTCPTGQCPVHTFSSFPCKTGTWISGNSALSKAMWRSSKLFEI